MKIHKHKIKKQTRAMHISTTSRKNKLRRKLNIILTKKSKFKRTSGGSKNYTEADAKYVSPRGVLKSCDIHSNLPVNEGGCNNFDKDYNMQDIKDGSSIYIKADCVKNFIETKYKTISNKIILVVGDSDHTFSGEFWNTNEDFIKFIESPNIIHMFAINSTITHPKFTAYPIGLDYHTLSEKDCVWGPQTSVKDQDAELALVQSKMKPFSEREIKCYGNFHFQIHRADRKVAKEQIPSECIFYEEKEIPRIETWTKQINYAFIVSPHGNGLDCQRTWEALFLGSIPIVKTSVLDVLYEELPVLIVKEWSDVSNILLKSTVKEFSNKKFNYDKLLLKYWMDKINDKKK